MSISSKLSVTIITKNEEMNIARAIESVRFADDILVIDSGSTDQTVTIAKQLGARVIVNSWTGYGQQKNFAQKNALHDWVLNIDADEVVPEALALEIQQKLSNSSQAASQTHGFLLKRKTYYKGRWIKHGGWYPNHLLRLTSRLHSSWTEPPVHEALVMNTPEVTPELQTPLDHFGFSGIEDQVLTNLRYAKLGSEELARKGKTPSLSKLLFKPFWKFLECYILKKGFLDGVPGLLIAMNASYSLFLKYAFHLESSKGNMAKTHANPRH